MILEVKKLVVLVAFLLLPGCSSAPPPAPVNTTRSGVKPVLTPVVGESKEMQVQGDITVTAVPVRYGKEIEKIYEVTQQKPPLMTMVVSSSNSMANNVYTKVTIEENEVIKPYGLAFQLTLNNQMSRVLRGAGIVPQITVNGRSASLDPSLLIGLQTMMLPPRGEQTITIYGLPWADLKEGELVGLSLFDVPTEVGVDGNVKKKANFEWVFEYRSEPVQLASTTVSRNAWYSVPNYSALMASIPAYNAELERERRGELPPAMPGDQTRAVNRMNASFSDVR